MTRITITSYEEAERVLAGGRDRADRPVGNNIRLQRRSDTTIALRYHATDIVVYHADGRVQMFSGGWRTYTTKERLNTYTPTIVHQTDGEWFVRSGLWNDAEASVHVFDEGITWLPDGSLTGGLDITEATRKQDHARKVRRDVRSFVNSITPDRILSAWQNTAGDCLLCRVDCNSDVASVTADHLASHVEEGYFMASLAYAAIRRSRGNPDIVMSRIYGDAQRGRVGDLLRKPLAKYLRAHLVPELATR